MVKPIQFADDTERAVWIECAVHGDFGTADVVVEALRARSTSLIHRGTRAVSRDAIAAAIAAEGLALSAEDAVRVATGVEKAFQGVSDDQ